MTILQTRALLLAGALSLAACDGDDTPTELDGPDDDGTSETEVTAVVDGEPFTASLVTVTAIDDSLGYAESIESADWINIIASGFPDHARLVAITLYDLRTGERDADENLVLTVSAGQTDHWWTTACGEDLVGTGSLDLDLLSDDRIAGSFEFEGSYCEDGLISDVTDRVVVADGRFDIAIESGAVVQPAGRRPSPKR